MAQEARDDKGNTAGEARTLHLQIPKEEDFSQGTADTRQCKGSRKRARTMGLLEDKTAPNDALIPSLKEQDPLCSHKRLK